MKCENNEISKAYKITKLENNERIAITDKINANEVFSFGRDHGHYGRILNQTVVSIPSLNDSKVKQFWYIRLHERFW